jgi:Cu+-exporting ATPase
MVKVLDVEGMMCAHCQSHVQSALEKVEGVSGVSVSLEEKQARVSMTAEVADDKLIGAVTVAGYKVLACRTE